MEGQLSTPNTIPTPAIPTPAAGDRKSRSAHFPWSVEAQTAVAVWPANKEH